MHTSPDSKAVYIAEEIEADDGLTRNSAALLAGNNESMSDQVTGTKSRPFPDEWRTSCEFIIDPAAWVSGMTWK